MSWPTPSACESRPPAPWQAAHRQLPAPGGGDDSGWELRSRRDTGPARETQPAGSTRRDGSTMAKENDTCMRAGSNRATVDYRCAAWSDESLTIPAVTPGLRGNGAKW